MKFHVESGSEGSKKLRDEFGAAIGGNMRGYTMLGEDVHDEQVC